MITITPRKLTDLEISVVARALEVLAEGEISSMVESLEELRVVARCECGCATIDFIPPEATVGSRPIAEGIGSHAATDDVGVIVWAKDGQLTGLEVYGFGEAIGALPQPETLRRWTAQEKR